MCTIIIKKPPEFWTIATVRGKFSMFGNIEEITVRENAGGKNSFIVEYEDETDAAAAILHHMDAPFTVTQFKPQLPEDMEDNYCQYSYINTCEDFVDAPRNENVEFEELSCLNPKCMSITTGIRLMKDVTIGCRRGSYFCCRECATQGLCPDDHIMYDKFNASVGRSGTGILKQKLPVEKLLVTVHADGVRSVTVEKE